MWEVRGWWMSWQLKFLSSQRFSDKKCTPPLCRGHRCTHHSSHSSMTCNMSCDQSYPFPQVFLVDEGGGRQYPAQPPNLVPCWSFPPAQEKLKSREKSRGYSPGVALIVLMLFLLVFAALGFEAYQIYKLQTELKRMREVRSRWMYFEINCAVLLN